MIAMSFPCWRCVGCRNVCEWQDAVAIEEDGKLIGFRHVDCEAPE